MLEIKEITNLIENELNEIAQSYGAIPFKLYTDLGDYREAYRVVNNVITYQFGILDILPSEIIPIQGLSMQNIVARLECAVNIDQAYKDEDGHYTQVENVRKVLDTFARTYTGKIDTITGENGKDYTVAYTMNPCSVGSVAMTTSDLGEIVPINITIQLGIVENGVNSNDIKVFIDGNELYKVNIQATRKRVPNENSFSNSPSTRISIQQNGFGLDIVTPILYNELGEMIIDDIYGGKDNVAHCVSVEFAKLSKTFNYIMTFGNNSHNTPANSNIAANISLVEGVESLMEYSDKWHTETKTTTQTDEEVEFEITAKYAVIWFGDGTSQIYKNNLETITHTYHEIGTYKVRYFLINFDLANTTWEFNNILTRPAEIDYSIDFNTSEKSYDLLKFEDYGEMLYEWEMNYNTDKAYRNQSTGGFWVKHNVNKRITITGGIDVTNVNLINWLKANATLKE